MVTDSTCLRLMFQGAVDSGTRSRIKGAWTNLKAHESDGFETKDSGVAFKGTTQDV